MDPIIILQAGVASGTVLLFATLGEVFAERSGVLNLGVEGMMLIGAMTAFSVTIATKNPWVGVLAAMLVAGLISQIHAALVRVSSGRIDAPTEPAKPAVSVKKSISPDYIVCLEDGKRFNSLKRHLRTQYNMTPEQYRDKWGLPPDYPMVAPNYAVARSQLAKEMGLGQQRRRRSK